MILAFIDKLTMKMFSNTLTRGEGVETSKKIVNLFGEIYLKMFKIRMKAAIAFAFQTDHC